MGTTNPLRGQGAMSSVGVFYYVVKNLPDSWNTCFSNVHLLALCYSHDLKVHGFSPILDKFSQELTELSSTGFQGVFPVIGQANICVELFQVACDNLALNSMLGFIESFSGDYFCTLCYATRASIQVGFVEECFQMRKVNGAALIASLKAGNYYSPEEQIFFVKVLGRRLMRTCAK
jgi:hypothetical protein